MGSDLIYRVTAPVLNLWATASKTAAKQAVLATGDRLTSVEDPTPTAGWVKVGWRGVVGYVPELSVTPSDSPIVGAAGTSTSARPNATAAPLVDRRDADPLRLHPTVRSAVAATLQALHAENIPFRVFEGFRSPERQNWLYAQGRTRSGEIVTKAEAWQSYHQYGLAVDLVLFRDNAWSWSDSGTDAAYWTRMHDIARAHGLRPLSFEAPHVEFVGPNWRDLQRGQSFPPNGDASWLDAVTDAAVRWGAAGGAPPLQRAERPPLHDPSG